MQPTVSDQLEAAADQGILRSRNVTIAGKRTSIRLEPGMWGALKEICLREGMTLHEACSSVAKKRTQKISLTAAIRAFIVEYYRNASTEEGHIKAGHGLPNGKTNANSCANGDVAAKAVPAAVSKPAMAQPSQAISNVRPFSLFTDKMNGTSRY